MPCPACKDKELVRVLTKQGVEVEYCLNCYGIWLDKGEIYYFTKTPTYLKINLQEALKSPSPSSRLNPKSGTPLVSISLFNLAVDYCPQTSGIWLDAGELEKLPGVNPKELNITLDKNTLFTAGPIEQRKKERLSAIRAGLTPLPNLALASSLTLVGLYALLTLILILCVQLLRLEPYLALLFGLAFAILHFLLGPYLMDLSLKFFFKVNWLNPEQLPAQLRSFIERISADVKMRFPRLGIIPDGSPQAFTYGHHPNNARIVISHGLMLLLGGDELDAVVAHEIGHAKHWDMLVMTLASLVPLILYYIYRSLIRMRTRGRDKSAAARYAIAICAYILYLISEYLVLWFSRIREYFADRFSGRVTGNPSALASALVKIGYGLAGQKPQKAQAGQRRPETQAIGALGIFDQKSANALAVAGYSSLKMGGEVNKELLKEAMKWDLWNPWALYYELHSTHPLIAKRLDRLSEQSVFLHKEPYVIFDRQKPESFWDEFWVDVLIKSLPYTTTIAAVILFFSLAATNPLKFLALVGCAFGAGYLINVWFGYAAEEFPQMNISGLLKKVKVSDIRPVPCTLKGKIIGRGIPGLIWSEDFVLQDDTGIIFLDYRQPLGIWEFLFGLLRARTYINEEVVIVGWYRRSPVPFVEIRTLTDSCGRNLRAYVYPVKLAVSIILIVTGLIFSLL